MHRPARIALGARRGIFIVKRAALMPRVVVRGSQAIHTAELTRPRPRRAAMIARPREILLHRQPAFWVKNFVRTKFHRRGSRPASRPSNSPHSAMLFNSNFSFSFYLLSFRPSSTRLIVDFI